MKSFSRTALAILFLGLFAAPALAAPLPEYITHNLAPGDAGDEVSLLQTWLAKDPAVYPEGAINGTYGAATEAAVKRYQEKKGMILNADSAGAPSGVVGPMTRANLNADYSKNGGGIAAVEAEYGDAWHYNGTKFVRLPETKFAADVPVSERLNVWVQPAGLSPKDSLIFSNGAGYGVGITDQGRLFAEAPNGRAETHAAYLNAGTWQHVSVIFTDADAVFIYNNRIAETDIIQTETKDFFSQLFSRIGDVFKTLSISTAARGNLVTLPSEFSGVARAHSDGIFGGIASFFSGIFGTSKPPEPAPESATVPAETNDGGAGAETANKTESVSEPAPTAVSTEDTTPSKPVATTTTLPLKPSVFSSLPPPPPVDFISPFRTAITTSTIPAPRVAAPTPATTTVTAATSTASSTALAPKTASSTTATSSKASPPPNVVYSGGSGSAPAPSAPAITLSGSSAVSIDIGTVYTDPGATASDSSDGNITSRIVVGGDAVNPDLAGTYHITYNVTNSRGVAAAQVTRTVTVNPPASVPTSAQEPNYTLAPAGQDVALTVSDGSGADPAFSSVDINPLHVYVGDTQTFTVNVSSPDGVASVDAVTQLDTITHTMHLTKTADNGTSATFSGSWTVYDTHTALYRTQFIATSNSGATNSTTMAWSDPCSNIIQGTNSTLGADCTVSTVYGLDGGNLTIPTGKTLTINSGAVWGFNPGTSVTIQGTGKIVKGTGGSFQKGYLFYLGTTNNNADATTMYFFTTTPQTGYVRVNTYAQSSYYSQSSYCFAPDTLVIMADGSEKPIEDIQIGEWVMGQDESGRHRPQLVTQTFLHNFTQFGPALLPMLKINGTLDVRAEHPMFTTRGLVNAGSLVVGDTLIGISGSVPVVSIQEGAPLPAVYNLEVYPNHNYFAGGVLVHNKLHQNINPP